jgi:hypothetical protein
VCTLHIKISIKTIITLVLLLFTVSLVKAQSTFSGTGNWSNAGNWSAGIPDGATNATIAAGASCTVDIVGAQCASLTIAGGTVSIDTLPTACDLSIAGNFTNSGTFSAPAGTTLTFNAASNSIISGGGTYTIAANVVLNMTSKTTVLDIQSNNFITGINSGAGYNFTFKSGTFKYNNTATLNDCHTDGITTALTIPFTVIIESDQGTLNLCPNGDNGGVILSGELYMNGGTVNVQDGQSLNAAKDFVYQFNGGTPQLYVSSGTLSVGSGFHAKGGGDYIDFNMSGGNITVSDQGMSKNYTFQLANVTGGSTIMSGGTIRMQDACNVNLPDIDMGGANVSPYSVTGGTVQFGNPQTQGGSTYFGIQPNGAHNYPNLDFQGGITKYVSPWAAGDFSVISIYICPAMTFDITGAAGGNNFNSNVTFIGTNGTYALNNSGNFVEGTGTFTFNCPTTSQLVTGSSTNEFGNVVIDNPFGVTFQIPTTIDKTLTLTNGNLTINTNAITFQDGNTPITRTNGTMSWVLAADLVFGTPGHTGGNAFTIPTGAFLGSNPTLDDFTINRDQSLALSENMVVQGTLTLTKGILDISGVTLTFDLGNVPISMGTGSITVSTLTSISFGLFHNTGGNAFTIPSNTFTGGIPSINNFTVYRTNPLTLGQSIIVNNLTISSGTFDVSIGNYAITVNGNWTNNGTFVPQAGTVTLSGNAFQRIDGTSVTNFYNLILNNTSITSPQFQLMKANQIVQNQLTMTAGNVNLAGFALTLGTSPGTGTLSHTGTAASGWLYGGNFTRYFDTPPIADRNVAGLFPVGSAADFRPFYVSYPATPLTTGGTITLTHTNATTVTNVNFPDGAFTVIRRHDAFWTCAAGGGMAAGGTPFDLSVEGTGFGLVSVVSDLRLTRINDVVGTDGGEAGIITNPQINRIGLSLINLTNNFYPASTNMGSPLPIELLSFNAVCSGDKVNLNWATSSETNNNFFIIEHSRNDFTWETVTIIPGAGNSNKTLTYSCTDNNSYSGTSYYRLKQTDYNGNSNYFDPIVVSCNSTVDGYFILKPNPASDEVTCSVFSTEDNNASIEIVSHLGQIMYLKNYSLVKGSNDFTMDVSSLTNGVYIVIVHSADGMIIETKQLLIQKK